MAAENSLYWPVPAIPPKPPQITLLGSSVAPPSTDDLNTAGAVQEAQKALANASNDSEIEAAEAALAEAMDALDMEAANLAKQLGMLPSELRAELDINDNEKWIRGFGYFPEAHSAAINRAPGDTTTVDNPLLPANLPRVNVQPWDLGTKFTLSALGWNAEDFIGRAERQNDAATPSALEYEFWTGTLAQANSWPNNYLCNLTSFGATGNITPGATNVHNGTPQTVTKGLQILQSYIARAGFGGQAMIHLTPEAAPNLLLTRRVGKFLLDQFDNYIVPGVGYPPNIGPANSTPSAGTAWMFATDMVATRIQRKTRVFPSTFAEALDRGQAGNPNTITFRAKRLGAAYWDNFVHVGVLVDLAS